MEKGPEWIDMEKKDDPSTYFRPQKHDETGILEQEEVSKENLEWKQSKFLRTAHSKLAVPRHKAVKLYTLAKSFCP